MVQLSTSVTDVHRGCTLEISGEKFPIDLILIDMREFCVIMGMDWMDSYDAETICHHKASSSPNPKWGRTVGSRQLTKTEHSFMFGCKGSTIVAT